MMSVTEKNTNTQVALQLIDAFNRRDFSQWAGRLADSFQANYPGAPVLNAEQARQYNESFLPAFPDLHFEAKRTLVDGDCVVIEWVASGTHEGTLTSASGATIPPTHRQGSVSGVLLSTIHDGKIARERTYWDQVEVLQQLGVMP
jgi:steroid delta-isomerase-like uncharacterized protein